MEEKNDILDRQKYVDNLIEIIECISNQKKGCSFAIDGKWGVGKTYILNMLEEQISKIQSEETFDDKYFIFNYNCWKYDYYEEPSVAIVSTMLDKVREENNILSLESNETLKASWEKAKEKIEAIAGEFSKNKIGINLVEIAKDIKDIKDTKKENIKANYDFDKLFSFKETLDLTRKKITELAQDKSIIFIVDELDRCLPTYAIKVLERLHHLFDGIDNVILIISIDMFQLGHSIKEIYGAEINVDTYLKKFINFSLLLDEGQLTNNFQIKYKPYFELFSDITDSEQELFNEIFTNSFKGIDIRTQEKLIYRAKIIHELLCKEEKLDLSLLCFELMYVAFRHKTDPMSLKFIPEINKAIYGGLAEKISKETENFLKNLESSVGKNGDSISCRLVNSRTISEAKVIQNRLSDKFFWIFASIYHNINEKTCFEYFLDNPETLKKEVEIAKKFESFEKILK